MVLLLSVSACGSRENVAKKDIFLVNKDGKYGFIDETGEWIVQPRFELAHGFTKDGLAPVRVDGKWGFIDEKGMWIIPPKFSDIGSSLDESMIPVQFDDGKYGYVDARKGKVTISPQFDLAFGFEFGYGSVEVNGKVGIINESGEMVVKPQFDNVFIHPKTGFAIIKVNDKWGVIDKSGEIIIEPQFDQIFLRHNCRAWNCYSFFAGR